MKLSFFDYSYVDTSFLTRMERQKDQIIKGLSRLKCRLPSFLITKTYTSYRLKSKNELLQNISFYYKILLAFFEKDIKNKSIGMIIKSSFDNQIQEKGGIVDCNGGIHTTAQSYKNYLKDNDLVIKDWSDGSNKPKQQLSDRAEIAKIVNKYI